MAKGPQQQAVVPEVKAGKADKPWQGAPRGYVNADITRAEKEDYIAWFDTNRGQDTWDAMCKMLDDGYRISISEGDKGFKAICTNVAADPASRGMCLVGYGSDAEKALGSLLYKHLVKLAGDWGSGDNEDDTYFR